MPESQTHAGFGKTDALLLLMALIWGVNFSIVKFATEVITPLAFTGLRVMLAAVVLITFALARGGKFPTRREILTLMALGMLGNGLYQIFFVEGLARTKVGNAALIVAATPAFIAIISRVGGIERVSRRVHAGIAQNERGVTPGPREERAASSPLHWTDESERASSDVASRHEFALRPRAADHQQDRTELQPRTSERPIRVPR